MPIDTHSSNAPPPDGLEDGYRLLADCVTDGGLGTLDSQGRVTRWNLAAERLLGYAATDLVGTPFARLWTAEDVARGEPAALLQAAGQGRAAADHCLVTRTGGRVRVHVTLTARHDARGTLAGFIVVLRAAEAESFLPAALDALSAHVCVLDEHGAILAVNRAWRQFMAANTPFGSGHAEGANYLAVCDAAAQSGSADAAGIRSVLRGERGTFIHTYACHSPTERRWFVGRVTRVAGDGPPRVVVAHENVSEQWRAEEQLRHHLRLTGLIASRAADALFLMDAEGHATYLNPAAEKLFGWRLEELAGVTLHDALHYRHLEGSALPLAECPLGRVMTAGTALQDHRDVFYHRDGRPIFVRCSNAPVVEDGVITGAVLVVSDDTARRQAEERLRVSEEKFRSLSACSPVGIFLTDPRGRCTYTNPRCQAICGFTFDEALGDGWARFIHPDDRRRLLEQWTATTREGRELSGVFRFQPRAGAVRRVHLRSSPMRDDAGRFMGHVGTAEDVTERHRLEAELRERAERLLEADRRKDEWVSMLAHELRGPLTPMRNAVQVLCLVGGVDPQVQKSRDVIARQIGHLAQIVNDLLEVTRLLRGKVRLRKERLDLARLIRTATDDYGGALEQAGLTLDVRTPPTPVWVQADTTRLTQVLNNFLDNAAKFTDRGGRVTVALTADADRQQAVLTVRDTGAGIEAEMLPRLFDVFSQADRSLHRAQGGLGLGLALVKSLVELHGGSVEAASEGPGRGAAFTVRLPLEKEPTALADIPRAAPESGQQLRILVVEDNRDSADSLRMLLELLGHEVRVAYTGTEGVAAAAEYRPDAILSDIGLPGLDGFGVARALRRNPTTAKTRLIAITGYGSDEDRRRARESGFDHVLTKPAEPAALLELLGS